MPAAAQLPGFHPPRLHWGCLESHRWPSVAKSDGSSSFLSDLIFSSISSTRKSPLWCLRQNSLLIFFMSSHHPFSWFYQMHLLYLISKCWTFSGFVPAPFPSHAILIHCHGYDTPACQSCLNDSLQSHVCSYIFENSTWMFTRHLKVNIQSGAIPFLSPRNPQTCSVAHTKNLGIILNTPFSQQPYPTHHDFNFIFKFISDRSISIFTVLLPVWNVSSLAWNTLAIAV